MFTANDSISEILARHASAGAVLERFDIDGGKHANDTLAQVCARLQLSVDQVNEKLEEAEQRAGQLEAPDVSGYSLTRLIQHVVRVHHRCVREQLPNLILLGRKVADAHAMRAPRLKDFVALLQELRAEMLLHFEDEEQLLFPYIAQLEDDARFASFPATGQPQTLAGTLLRMAQEHEGIALLLNLLQQETRALPDPEWACARLSAFLAGLRAFTRDLERHLELENGILFPRALQLEAALGVVR